MPLLLAVAFSIFPLPHRPLCAGRFGLYGWLRMLVVSYFSNLVGALLLVGLPGVGWRRFPCVCAAACRRDAHAGRMMSSEAAATAHAHTLCPLPPINAPFQVGLMKGGDVFHSGRGDFLMELAEVRAGAAGWDPWSAGMEGLILRRGSLCRQSSIQLLSNASSVQNKVAYGWGAVLLRGKQQGCFLPTALAAQAVHPAAPHMVPAPFPSLQACWATGWCAWQYGSECRGWADKSDLAQAAGQDC